MKPSKPQGSAKSMRWFLLMNIVVTVALVCGAIFLKKGTDKYKQNAQFDRTYIITAKAEQNPKVLHKGLIYTEGARSMAYKSILNLSQGTSIIWLIVAIAFIANTVYLFRISLEQKKHLATTNAI